MNAPNGSNIFSDLGGIRGLKLRQLRVALDFKEGLLSGGRHNLRIRHRQDKGREIKAERVSIHQPDRGNGMSKGRADLDVDRCIPRITGVLSLRLLLFGLGVGHGTEVINEV